MPALPTKSQIRDLHQSNLILLVFGEKACTQKCPSLVQAGLRGHEGQRMCTAFAPMQPQGGRTSAWKAAAAAAMACAWLKDAGLLYEPMSSRRVVMAVASQRLCRTWRAEMREIHRMGGGWEAYDIANMARFYDADRPCFCCCCPGAAACHIREEWVNTLRTRFTLAPGSGLVFHCLLSHIQMAIGGMF